MSLFNPLVTVCCLSYNHGTHIRDCIDSISSQVYGNIEIIALDDGSTDNSVEELKRCSSASRFPLKILTQENTGCVGGNFNKLIANASGELICFISMDDRFVGDAISSKMSYFENDADTVFVANKLNNRIDAEGEYLCENESPIEWQEGIEFSPTELLELEYTTLGSFYIQGAIFNKKVIDEIYGFDEDQTGDDIVLRTKIFMWMIENGVDSCNVLDLSAVDYRIHDSNLHKNNVRQILIIHDWKKKFFPEREYPELFYIWLAHAVSNTFGLGRGESQEALLKIMGDLLKDGHLDYQQMLNLLKGTISTESIQTHIIGLPYIFCVEHKRYNFTREFLFKIFNYKLLKFLKCKRSQRSWCLYFCNFKLLSRTYTA